MADEAEWKQNTRILINEICTSWDLPLLPAPKTTATKHATIAKVAPQWQVRELEHEDDKLWQAGGERFVFITDSQIVKNVICGHATLKREKFRPIFQRVTKRLVSLIHIGLMPPTDVSDPVQWRPREYNVRAD